MIDSGTLARLVALGRRKGHLTNQDLEEALPVDTMSAGDIALVVVHLEETGVPVELDETLLARASTGRALEIRPAGIVLPANDPGSRPPRASDQPLSAAEAPSSRDNLKAKSWGGPRAHKAVLLAVILLLLLAFVALILST